MLFYRHQVNHFVCIKEMGMQLEQDFKVEGYRGVIISELYSEILQYLKVEKNILSLKILMQTRRFTWCQ